MSCMVCGGAQHAAIRFGEFAYCRCVGCGLMSMEPRPSAREIERHYADKFKHGNYSVRRKHGHAQVFDGYLGLLSKHMRLEGNAVLDIGCFTGEFPVALETCGAIAYGVELQPEAVEIARSSMPEGRIFRGDACTADLPAMRFDAITLLEVIEHLTDPVRALRRCVELLPPGGLLLIETPNAESALARIMRGNWPLYMPVEHLNLFSYRALARALADLGMEIIVKRRHFKWLSIGYVIEMFETWGPQFYRAAQPVYRLCPESVRRLTLPWYAGEMIVLARKRNCA